MASTIVTKNSSTASAVPVTGDLTQGELAVNVTDKRLFTKNSGGTVVELGTNPASLALSNGTANGVAYLNGSKVVTTGSALTFDGTNLGIGVSAANYANYKNLAIAGTTGANIDLISGSTIVGNIYNTSTDVVIQNSTSGPMRFGINGSEGMRLTSTGLGIGTSSPGSKLEVNGNQIINFSGQSQSLLTLGGGSTSAAMNLRGSTGSAYAWQISSNAFVGSALEFTRSTAVGGTTFSTPSMLLDSSGNLGLGVTPSAWSGVGAALQVGVSAAIIGNSVNSSSFISNAYFDGAAYRYIGTGFATRFATTSGNYSWNTAPSGTAGNAISFTQAMTLDASGNLGIGTTSPSVILDVQSASPIVKATATTGTNTASFRVVNTGGTSYFARDSSTGGFTGTAYATFVWGSGAYPMVFATNDIERARIDSSGNLLVNTTTANGKLAVAVPDGTTNVFYVERTGGAPATLNCNFANQYTNWNSSVRYQIVAGGSGGVYLATGGTSWTAVSDERLKTDLQPIENAATKVATLRAVTGRYKTDAEGTSRSFLIAQDVQAVLPEAVNIQDENTGTLGLSYTEVIPLLVAAIQEQQAIIQQLQADVAALKGN